MHTQMLSICGADMHRETPTGYTAIHIAALSGHVNCLKVGIFVPHKTYMNLKIFVVVACTRVQSAVPDSG